MSTLPIPDSSLPDAQPTLNSPASGTDDVETLKAKLQEIETRRRGEASRFGKERAEWERERAAWQQEIEKLREQLATIAPIAERLKPLVETKSPADPVVELQTQLRREQEAALQEIRATLAREQRRLQQEMLRQQVVAQTAPALLEHSDLLNLIPLGDDPEAIRTQVQAVIAKLHGLAKQLNPSMSQTPSNSTRPTNSGTGSLDLDALRKAYMDAIMAGRPQAEIDQLAQAYYTAMEATRKAFNTS